MKSIIKKMESNSLRAMNKKPESLTEALALIIPGDTRKKKPKKDNSLRIDKSKLYNAELAFIPDCASCGKRVEKVFTQPNFRTREHLYEVHCHGEIESFTIPFELLQEDNLHLITLQKAFVKKIDLKILENKKDE